MENKTTIAGIEMSAAIAQKLTDLKLSTLDQYERLPYHKFMNYGKEYALQLIINNAEGDYMQLSKGLAEIAEEQDQIIN